MHLLSGTIRRVSDTLWETQENASHMSRGIQSVDQFDDRLRVHHTFTAWKVSSLQVTPDERFSSAGVRVGASVGLAYTDIFFYMGASQVPVNPELLTRDFANVWLTGWFEETPSVAKTRPRNG